MTVTQEDIMAYVDGEMAEAERSRITLAALGDLDLADRIARERGLRERLQAHFSPVAAAPVPEAWTAMIAAASTPAPANVVDLAEVRARRSARMWRWPAMGAALAASLVIGLFVGAHHDGSAQFAAGHGALVASGDLAKALDGQLASAQGDTPVRMLASFRRQGGDVCRVFAGAAASGIACHGADGWAMQHVLPGTPASGVGAPTNAYRQAGSAQGDLMGLAQDMAVGEPFDAAQESAAKAKGWR